MALARGAVLCKAKAKDFNTALRLIFKFSVSKNLKNWRRNSSGWAKVDRTGKLWEQLKILICLFKFLAEGLVFGVLETEET